MRIGILLSFSDFSQGWGVSERTWGEAGVRSLVDSVHEAGVGLLLWRVPGFPSRGPYAEVRQADPSLKGGADRDYRWAALDAAVGYAHEKGMEVWSWYDQEDSHGGCNQQGRKHSDFILQNPHCLRRPRRDGLYDAIELTEHGNPDCPLQGKGTQGSLSYPEVQEHRLSVIGEALESGVDGLYIVNRGSIGYEEPVVAQFEEEHGLDPHQLPGDDERWLAVQGRVLSGYLQRVRGLLDGQGRDLRLTMETRGTKKGQPSLYPYIAAQAGPLLQTGVLDYLSVWTAEDVILLAERLGGDLSHVARRFEISTVPPPEQWWLWAGARAMSSQGLALFLIDEATNVEPDHWKLMGRFAAEFGD